MGKRRDDRSRLSKIVAPQFRYVQSVRRGGEGRTLHECLAFRVGLMAKAALNFADLALQTICSRSGLADECRQLRKAVTAQMPR